MLRLTTEPPDILDIPFPNAVTTNETVRFAEEPQDMLNTVLRVVIDSFECLEVTQLDKLPGIFGDALDALTDKGLNEVVERPHSLEGIGSGHLKRLD